MARSDAPQTDFGRISVLEGQPVADLLGDPRLVTSPLDHAEIARLGLSVYDTGALPAPLLMIACTKTIGAADSTAVLILPVAVSWRLKAASVRLYNPAIAPANLVDLPQADLRILPAREREYIPTFTTGYANVTNPGNNHGVGLASVVQLAGSFPRQTLAWSGDVVLPGGSTVLAEIHGSAAGDIAVFSLAFNRVIGTTSRPPY